MKINSSKFLIVIYEARNSSIALQIKMKKSLSQVFDKNLGSKKFIDCIANKNEKISFERNLDCIGDKKFCPKFSKEIQEARSNRGKFCFGHCGWMGRHDQGFMWISLPTISATAILDGEHDSWGFFFQKISSHKSKLCPHWKKGMLGAWTRIYENRPKPGYGQQGLKDGILRPRFNWGGKNSGFSQQKHHTFSFLTGSQLTINRCGEHDLCGFLILTLSTSKPRIYVDLSSGRGKIIFITILVIAIVYSVAI